MHATSCSPAQVATFDPTDWLARFEHSGGGWLVQPDRTWLIWPDLDNATALQAELDARGGKPAVLHAIRTRHEAQEA